MRVPAMTAALSKRGMWIIFPESERVSRERNTSLSNHMETFSEILPRCDVRM